ncbi:hypothetical protein LAh6_52 [Aeromonas phage LAh_6]|uniref:Uncharacterized protein n=2 Tax=Lahexavirus TaxID=2843411 RepID=A0A514A023_9CAUD|nr:hypothetical protein HWC29_gp149 [Aeromonas phage 4_4572]YP_009847226.1 hypothetical protein HWC30_gp052 [Aeromonas phage LAh_6]QDH46585.1 hypothetical protein LAh6_52 [Aeromonas phage LAh_6]QEG09037.1 hypothetical protein [Aeromonas phage 4_4572]
MSKRSEVIKYLIDLLEDAKPEYREHDETSDEHLKWMLLSVLSNDSIPQMNRWLGFVQGVLVTKDYITVAELREISRGIDNG